MKRLTLLTALLSLLVPAVPAAGDSVGFYQLDFDLAGNVIHDSDWGAVDFTYQGQAPLMYFNLAVNGSWQVQNVPVLSQEGVGVNQMVRYYFSLGVPRGTDVSTLNYAYSLLSDVSSSMPAGSVSATVLTDWYAQGPGFLSGGAYDVAAAAPLVGGKAKDLVKHFVDGMPNNEASTNGCTPTAFANSLQFLNVKKGLHLQDSQTSVAKLEQVVGYDAAKATISTNWYNLKKDYALTLGVTTRKTADIASLVNEIDGKQDIELVYEWGPATNRHSHMLVMTGITPQEDGTYSIYTQDDGQQGQPGGLRTTEWTYDPSTGLIKDGIYRTRELMYAIVECPEPTTMALAALGAVALLVRRIKTSKPRVRGVEKAGKEKGR